jgi:hypothetical protein
MNVPMFEVECRWVTVPVRQFLCRTSTIISIFCSKRERHHAHAAQRSACRNSMDYVMVRSAGGWDIAKLRAGAGSG